MAITIDGDGTITGVSVGGLPDGIVDTDMIAADAVTDAKQNLSGAAKAWVNFNGTGTVAIRTSFNIASITDNGTGDYTLTFTTAMTDANYAVVGMTAESGNPNRAMAQRTDSTIVNTSVRVGTFSTSGDVVADLAHNSVVVFR
jgi:hypothetical protein